MKTTLALLALFFFVLIGGYYLRPQPQMTYPSAVSNTSSSTVSATAHTSGSTSQPGTYTSAQVAAHNTSGSCWSIINGNVYDLTAWIAQHPGGEGAILSICGSDGSQAFNAQHGRPRDTQPKDILASFKIGTLAS